MSFKDKAARTAMAVGLGLALTLGVAAPSIALAVEGESTFTITGETGNTYTPYKVFDAEVDADGNATAIEWASTAAETAVKGFASSNGFAEWKTDNHRTGTETPQMYADFISDKINAMTDKDMPSATSFAHGLAKAVIDGGVSGETAVDAGEAFTGKGFYLFVSDDIAEGKAGTAPIFAPVGGAARTQAEKVGLPSVNKEVKENSTWGKGADSNNGEDVSYRLTGTVASNYAAYETYKLVFTDVLPNGMTLKSGDTSSVKVYLNNEATAANKISAGWTATFADGTLTVTIDNTKADAFKTDDGTAVAAGDKIIVTYDAQLTSNATIGSAGNKNVVTLTYSNDPMDTSSTGTTEEEGTFDYTYQLNVVKKDGDTAETLADVKFTVKRQDNKYVQADGTLGDTAYEFTTASDGTFTVPRIDAGTYTVHETSAPEGFDTCPDVTFTLTSTIDSTTGALTGLASTVSGGYNGTTGEKVKTEVTTAFTPATGAGTLTIANKKVTPLPITGAEGIMLFTVIGLGVVGISVAGMLRDRKRVQD